MEVTSLFNQPVRSSFLKLIYHQTSVLRTENPCFSTARRSAFSRDISYIENNISSTCFIVRMFSHRVDFSLIARLDIRYYFRFARTNTDYFIYRHFKSGDKTGITRRCYLLVSLTRD